MSLLIFCPNIYPFKIVELTYVFDCEIKMVTRIREIEDMVIQLRELVPCCFRICSTIRCQHSNVVDVNAVNLDSLTDDIGISCNIVCSIV